MPANAARILALIAIVTAIVVVMLVTGWADDRAPQGSQGRVPVTATEDSR